MINYKGKGYDIRWIDVVDTSTGEETTIAIATYSLQKALGEAPYPSGSKEERIDDGISFYLEDDIWGLSDAEIVEKHLYGSFTTLID